MVLRFEILGPQRAWRDSDELELGPGKQRAVLAVLLLHAGAPVPVAQIIDAVWQDGPPENGPNVVQKYVAGLRRVLEPDRSPRTPGQLLALTETGYLLRVGSGCLDADMFDQRVRQAQVARARGRLAEAATEMRAALALWRGEPLAGLTGPVFDAARVRLVEKRATALEAWAEIGLELGQHRAVVGDLVEMTAEFPLRERLRGALMLALYRCGRQAEALATFRDLRALLAEEYGIEPGEDLQQLHRQILRSDPALAPPQPAATRAEVAGVPPAPPAGPAPAVVPAESADPAPAGGFAGPAPAGPAEPATAVGRVAAVGPAAAVGPVAAVVPAGSASAVEPAGPVGVGVPLPGVWPGPFPAMPPPPAPGEARVGRHWVAWLGTGLGVMLALASAGFLTWAVVLYYAGRRRSLWLGGATAGYLALIGLFLVLLDTEEETLKALDVVAILALLAAWLGGAVHILLLNEHLLGRAGGRRPHQPPAGEVTRRLLREQARYLLYHYPAARTELRIGRPDLPRSYDDGGLVDVNAVAAEVIEKLPGLAPHQGRHIAVERQLRGPFASVEELAARCLLPLPSVDALRDVLLFLPPWSGPAVTTPTPPVAPSLPTQPNSAEKTA